VVQLRRAHEEFDRAGVPLVLIGQATPRHASRFRERLDLDPLPILADEERESYRAAGWRRGNVSQLLGPRSVLSGVKHGARSGDKELARRPADLLAAALPVWKELLRPGGAIGIAFNARVLPRRELAPLVAGAGFEIFDSGAYLDFEHRVDQVIVRDILVGARP
jgi:hypothetical protein